MIASLQVILSLYQSIVTYISKASAPYHCFNTELNTLNPKTFVSEIIVVADGLAILIWVDSPGFSTGKGYSLTILLPELKTILKFIRV